MSYALQELLSSRSREEIEATLDYFDALPPFRHGRKQELVNRLTAYLSSPEVWLGKLMEQDLRLLKTLCDAGPDSPVEMIQSDYPSVLEVMHFVECSSKGPDDLVSVSIPEVFYKLIAPYIGKVVEDKEQDGTFELEHIILGTVNFYGVVPLKTFVNCIFRDFEDMSELHRYARNVASHPIVRLYQETYRGESYLVSPYIENFEEHMQQRSGKYKQVRKYAVSSSEDVVSCGTNAPFCFFGEDTPEGRALAQMLYELGYDGDAILAMAHSIWLNSQFEPDEHNTEMLLYPVTSLADEIGSLELFTDYVNIIVNYANKVPKWLLKGHSADETGLMLYLVSEAYIADLYGPEISGGMSDELVKFFSTVGKVRPVSPDEPCPCGSGLSYRYCHGKHYS